jgi:hypothetical protein
MGDFAGQNSVLSLGKKSTLDAMILDFFPKKGGRIRTVIRVDPGS